MWSMIKNIIISYILTIRNFYLVCGLKESIKWCICLPITLPLAIGATVFYCLKGKIKFVDGRIIVEE